jgi:hypothetical protein
LSRRGSQRPKVAFEGNDKPPNLVAFCRPPRQPLRGGDEPVGRRRFVVALLVVAGSTLVGATR